MVIGCEKAVQAFPALAQNMNSPPPLFPKVLGLDLVGPWISARFDSLRLASPSRPQTPKRSPALAVVVGTLALLEVEEPLLEELLMAWARAWLQAKPKHSATSAKGWRDTNALITIQQVKVPGAKQGHV